MKPTELVNRLLQGGDYTHASLAKAVGVSQPTITRIANGQAGCSLETWRSLVALHGKHFPDVELTA